jgi:hypothetical protein
VDNLAASRTGSAALGLAAVSRGLDDVIVALRIQPKDRVTEIQDAYRARHAAMQAALDADGSAVADVRELLRKLSPRSVPRSKELPALRPKNSGMGQPANTWRVAGLANIRRVGGVCAAICANRAPFPPRRPRALHADPHPRRPDREGRVADNTGSHRVGADHRLRRRHPAVAANASRRAAAAPVVIRPSTTGALR